MFFFYQHYFLMKKFAVKVACLFNIYTFFKGISHLYQRKRCKVSLIQKTLTIKANNTKNLERNLANQGMRFIFLIN
ncbi:hypothetical protein AKG37_17465 [Bacillus australimaris]|uniref:Transposase n=1 Tax=Bacillus australimaris TaxID=1326968 RepID=A0ABR5MWG7_9BACI|nr:hypothetical protein AKG37_17465 [Bacillus australimaris]